MYVNTDTPSVYTTPRLFCWLHSAEQHVNLCHTGSQPFSYNPFSNCEWNFISFVGPDWTKKPHFLCPELYLRGSTQNISTHTHTLWDTQCVCTAVENLHYHGGRLPSSTVTSNRVSLSQLCVCVCARATESLQVYGCVSDSIFVCVCYRVSTWFTVRGETPVNSLFGVFVQACRRACICMRACMFWGAPDHGRTGSGRSYRSWPFGLKRQFGYLVLDPVQKWKVVSHARRAGETLPIRERECFCIKKDARQAS